MADVYKHGICNLMVAAAAADGSGGLFLNHDPWFTKTAKAPFATDKKRRRPARILA